jgi:hypothetical protein
MRRRRTRRRPLMSTSARARESQLRRTRRRGPALGASLLSTASCRASRSPAAAGGRAARSGADCFPAPPAATKPSGHSSRISAPCPSNHLSDGAGAGPRGHMAATGPNRDHELADQEGQGVGRGFGSSTTTACDCYQTAPSRGSLIGRKTAKPFTTLHDERPVSGWLGPQLSSTSRSGS